jgi:hypothetical protein
MKRTLTINPILLLTVTAIILSCNNNSADTDKNTSTKETTEEKLKTTSSADGDNTISFYLNGDEDLVSTKADVMLNEINGKRTLTISNTSTDSKKHLVIDVNESVVGRQGFDEQGKYGHPKATYMPDLLQADNTYTFNMGDLEITAIDLKNGGTISGTFSGSAKNNKGELISISKGKITNAKIGGGVFTTK